jgi:hypothetical protein
MGSRRRRRAKRAKKLTRPMMSNLRWFFSIEQSKVKHLFEHN